MPTWFIAHAPIRLKLLLAFGLFVAILAAEPLVHLTAGEDAAMFYGIGATLVAIAAAAFFRYAITRPYVTTVMRMEALAAGDLASPIAFTEYRDCVGRMTKAMFTFREAAQNQIALNQQAAEHARIVQGMTANLKRLADGDLTAEITEHYPDDYAPLKANFNAALQSLRTLIGSVGETTATVHTGSSEIARASDTLARRAQSNAASLEQTSAAIAQVDERLKTTATAAMRTVERADGAIATVSRGRSVTHEAVQAMTRVSDSAKGIDDVIEGLDKIAFQTRVLAMNAAVEAGRAGDAGRGFAVVADLVSALAMRAEEEAKRARSQLTVTQAEVLTAVDMVQKVDGALDAIFGDVHEVHALLGGMADDNRSQALTISQISEAVGTMDQATQQIAAMVEETSCAARKLSEEVDVLGSQTARFTTGAPAASARRLQHAPARPALVHREAMYA